VRIADVEKPLADCTRADLDLMARGARPATPGSSRDITTESNYALLAQEMQRAGVARFGELGPDRVSKGEQLLGLHYAGASAILKSLGAAGPGTNESS
jgi:hypothetical protein